MGLLTALMITSMQAAVPASAPGNAIKSGGGQTALSAEDAFNSLARMVGVWRPADKPQSPLRIRFYLTAGGTVLVESWEASGKPHSLTLYYRDGKTLLATHYCPQGNQPRLALKGRDTSGLHFVVRDITDLEPGTETHQHDLWIDLTDAKHPVRSETYASKEGVGAQERMRLVAVN